MEYPKGQMSFSTSYRAEHQDFCVLRTATACLGHCRWQFSCHLHQTGKRLSGREEHYFQRFLGRGQLIVKGFSRLLVLRRGDTMCLSSQIGLTNILESYNHYNPALYLTLLFIGCQ